MTPMPTMPFGKHKGKPIDACPRDYLRWVLTHVEGLAPPIRAAITGLVADADAPARITRDDFFALIPGNPGLIDQAAAILEGELDVDDGEYLRDACEAACDDPGQLPRLLHARRRGIEAREYGHDGGRAFALAFARFTPPPPPETDEDRFRRLNMGHVREHVEPRIRAALGRGVTPDAIRAATPDQAAAYAGQFAGCPERVQRSYRNVFAEAVALVLRDHEAAVA